MSSTTPSPASEPTQPQLGLAELGVAYPLKIGESLHETQRRYPPREFLALNYSHLLDKTDVHYTGHLTVSKERVVVALAGTGSNSFFFTGVRSSMRADYILSDYVLVLVDGVVWVERANDIFYGLKLAIPVHGRVDRTDVEVPDVSGDVAADPDSWMTQQRKSDAPPAMEEEDGITRDIQETAGTACSGAIQSDGSGSSLTGANKHRPASPPRASSSAAEATSGMGGLPGVKVSPPPDMEVERRVAEREQSLRYSDVWDSSSRSCWSESQYSDNGVDDVETENTGIPVTSPPMERREGLCPRSGARKTMGYDPEAVTRTVAPQPTEKSPGAIREGFASAMVAQRVVAAVKLDRDKSLNTGSKAGKALTDQAFEGACDAVPRPAMTPKSMAGTNVGATGEAKHDRRGRYGYISKNGSHVGVLTSSSEDESSSDSDSSSGQCSVSSSSEYMDSSSV